MSEYYIRIMDAAGFKPFYRRIKRDFLPEEHAPYGVLCQQLQSGVQEGLIFSEGDRDVAYAICAAGHSNGYVLISLLAVFEEYRGRGIGSTFLDAICKRYSHKQGILVEVERPELSQSPGELDARRRRIEFYQRAGYYLVPDIEYSIWEVPMHLMAMPVLASVERINKGIGQFMYEIYHQLMGDRFIHKMVFHNLGKNEGDSL